MRRLRRASRAALAGLVAALAAALLLAAPATADYEFERQWGSYGSGKGQFILPISVATDTAGNVYVGEVGLESNGSLVASSFRVQKFDSGGMFLASWGGLGSGDSQFSAPCGIATDREDNVYVADSDGGGNANNARVLKFDSSGKFLTKWGSPGSGDGEFLSVCGIAADPVEGIGPSGNIYVTDFWNGGGTDQQLSRVQRFDDGGKFVKKWGSYGTGNGQFGGLNVGPGSGDIATGGFPFSVVGNLYVADTQNDRIQKFDSNGDFITTWGAEGSDEGQFDQPTGVATDPTSGNVLVVEGGNNRVQEFTPTGTFVSTWGSKGSGKGQFSFPLGIATDPAGNVYVVDTENYRVQKFSPTAPGGAISGSVKAKRTQRQKGKRVAVKVKVKAAEDLTAKGAGKIRVGKRAYKLKRTVKRLSSGERKSLSLKPKRTSAAKQIVRALKRGKKARAKLVVTLIDQAGNRERHKLGVKLKR
jgi:DNA-binding beta-propeller fold protein YncE